MKVEASEDQPFVLLAYIVLFAQIDKVCDRLGGKKLKAIDNVNLRKGKADGVRSREKRLCKV